MLLLLFEDGNKWLELHPSPDQHLSWVKDHNQIPSLDQENLIDKVNYLKSDDYKETIAKISQNVQWDRTYRGF